MSILESNAWQEAEELAVYSNMDKVENLAGKRIDLEAKKVSVKDKLLDCKASEATCRATFERIKATAKICSMAGIATNGAWGKSVAAEALKEIGYDVIPEELQEKDPDDATSNNG